MNFSHCADLCSSSVARLVPEVEQACRSTAMEPGVCAHMSPKTELRSWYPFGQIVCKQTLYDSQRLFSIELLSRYFPLRGSDGSQIWCGAEQLTMAEQEVIGTVIGACGAELRNCLCLSLLSPALFSAGKVSVSSDSVLGLSWGRGGEVGGTYCISISDVDSAPRRRAVLLP